ncbi:MAG: CDP-diacylglycerol--glycerol-3-phosphate 3-phosphatidyltransferase [Clostridia bacterium]|nr:CDP-diacylglycerol--glycerol-3-phosphate 3-phosphatidyltransferase [Clostridia bacterium]MBO7151951.1 CDP-diacylglycerol--glycerol-3-phosphate 3-phosphatidyltransferase [Clostridia bacterium]
MKLTLATKITIARIFLIIPTVILFVLGMVYQADSTLYAVFMALSSFLFVFLCVTDILDGHIARKTGTVTDLGKFLDPIADKVVVVVMLLLVICHGVGLAIFPYNSLVIALLGGIVLSRELIIGAFRCIAAGKGLVLAADIYGKVKTVLLDIGIAILILGGTHDIVAWIGTVVFYAGSIMAVVSGINYVVKNKHVLLDKEPEAETAEEIQAVEAEEVTAVEE